MRTNVVRISASLARAVLWGRGFRKYFHWPKFAVMKRIHFETGIGILLVGYLLLVGIGASITLIANFPTTVNSEFVFPSEIQGKALLWPFGIATSNNQALMALAFLAGTTGSFLHAAQSLATYLGNRSFKPSWTAWYFLRPWIGGVLGLSLYFVIRAGLIGGVGGSNEDVASVNPFGLVAVGLLGGWFSKTTTDKLQEVFETLFKTNQDGERADKLIVTRPLIERIEPSPVPSGQSEFKVVGENFQQGAVTIVGDVECAAKFESSRILVVKLEASKRPSPGTQISIVVRNPEGTDPLSSPHRVEFK